jgi:hypothetical protein
VKTTGIHEQILKNQETILGVLEFLITIQGFGDEKDLKKKQQDLMTRRNETYRLRTWSN